MLLCCNIVDGTFVCTNHCNYIILYKIIMIFVVRTITVLVSQVSFVKFFCQVDITNEESNSTAYSSARKFLYNSKGLDVISLLIKYYVPLAHINKVIKLLMFKSAINLLNGKRNRENVFYCKISHSIAKSHSVALSRLRFPLETANLLQI